MNESMETSPWTWPMWWRIIMLLNISFYNLMGNVFAAGITPLFGLFIQEFHCTINEASRLATYALLTLGLANLWALPTAQYIGKRYTILISLVIFLAANIWAAKASTYDSLMGSRFIGGLSGGIIEAVGPLIVSEMFPEHQLARAMVIYVGFLAAGSAIGPIVAGFIASGLHSWRWFFGITSIAAGVNLLGCILMLPETTHRGVDFDAKVPTPDQEAQSLKQPNAELLEEICPVNSTPDEPDRDLMSLWTERSFFTHLDDIKPEANWFRVFVQPLPLLLAPQVFVTTLIFGLTIGWTALISTVCSNVFQAPPTLWGPRSIGLLNFGPIVGLTIGLPLGGALADFLSTHGRKSAGGYHDPKSRLPAVLIGAIVSPAGCLVIGFSLQNHLPWIGVAAGWAMLAFGLTGSANVLLTYSVDCFRARAGHVGVLVNVVKNSLAFGVSFASMDWFVKSGPVAQFGTMAGLLWACYLLAIPLYFFSERVDKFSRRFV